MKGIVHRRLRTAILIYVVAIIGLLLGLRGGYIALPMYFVFPAFLSLLVCPTLFWWLWMDEWTAAFGTPRDSEGPSGRRSGFISFTRIVLGLYTLATLAPVALLLFGRRAYDALPVPMLMWLMAWHLSVALAGLIGLIVWLPWIGVTGAGRLLRRPGPDAVETQQPDAGEGRRMGRRALITGAVTCAPILLAGGTVASGLRQQGRFIIRRIEMRLPRLPERLKGLTITHLSDFHVGRLFRPEHLGRVVEATNKLKSDLIVITGDTVDHSADFLPAACDAFAQMESRYGRYVVIGNHDLMDSPREAVRYIEQREPDFLSDRCRTLEISGEWLRIAGLFWSRYDRAKLGAPGHYERVHKVLGGTDPKICTVALAHHPHAFDALADAGADLTLAGHTHGGQLMLTPPGSPVPIGGGNLLFRYIWGEYRRGDAALYVNSGVGNWFPVRFNAPAEIVQIRLV